MGRSGVGLQGDRGDDGGNCEAAVCLLVVSRGFFVLASVVVTLVLSLLSKLSPPPWSAPAGLLRTARHSLVWLS